MTISIDEYFQIPEAQRILLVEVQRNDAASTRYYMSDSPYVTEPSDTPANLSFAAAIGGAGLPELRRTLNDPFSGAASVGFGSITLVESLVTYTDNVGRGEATPILPRGAVVYMKIAAPRVIFPYSDAINLAVGKVARTGGDSDGTMTFEVTDGSETFKTKTVEISEFPLCFGFCRNVTPNLINPASLIYAVHDGPIQGITAVYDQGVALGVGQYTVNLATGQFTLNQSPVGVITADVQGAKPSGTWLQTTESICRELITRAGITLIQTYTDIPANLVGLYITENKQLGELLNTLLVGCAAYWIVDPDGKFTAQLYPIPTLNAGPIFTEMDLIDLVSFQDEDRLYSKINFTYRTNWTQYQSLDGATSGQAEFSNKNYLEASVVDGAPIAEYSYQDSPKLETLFDDLGAAQATANRLLTLYRQPRKIVSATVPFTQTLRLAQSVQIVFGSYHFHCSVIGLSDVFDGQYPTQKLELLA